MDSFGSIALATEPPKISLLDRPPHGRDEYIISRRMVKHLIGMALYEIIICYAIVFGGDNFMPEPELKWRFDRPDVPYVYPGRIYDWDGTILWKKYESTMGPSRHMTTVFNTFVVMQIFNFVNSRKVNDERNIFDGITENKTFGIVWLMIAGG